MKIETKLLIQHLKKCIDFDFMHLVDDKGYSQRQLFLDEFENLTRKQILDGEELDIIEGRINKGFYDFLESELDASELKGLSMSEINAKMDVSTWHEFLVGDVFEIKGPKKPISKKHLIPGDYPYITCSNANNGAAGTHHDYNTAGNCLTFDSATTGAVFYQKNDFMCSEHVENARLKGYQLNEYLAMFLCAILNSNKTYSYGKKRNKDRFKKEKILLPSTKNSIGNIVPDYDLMEVVGKMQEIKASSTLSACKREDGSVDLELAKFIAKHPELDAGTLSACKRDAEGKPKTELRKQSDNWSEFVVGDVFEVKRGTRYKKTDRINGDYPLVTASGQNNGNAEKVDNNLGNEVFRDCITVSRLGECFYHGYDFVCDDNVMPLINNNYNKYSALFIVSILSQVVKKYSFSKGLNQTFIKKEKILLPSKTDEFGKVVPDYQYMEEVVKSAKFSALI